MKNKGFTLVELLAVVAILAVIIGLSFVVFTRVQDDVLTQELENTVSYIEAQAENYANDTNITVVSVEDLILSGYVEPDDETDIYNPVDNSSLNCYIVRSTYEDGEFTAQFDFDTLLDRNENGTCNSYVQEAVISIGVKEEESVEYSSEIKDWYKNNVELAVLGANKTPLISDTAIYEWRSNYGEINTTPTVITTVSEGIVSNIPYSVTINYEEEGQSYNAEATATINIDRESPRIISVNVPNSTEWTTSKTVTITATDGNGSGLKGIYVGKDLTTCTEDLNYTEVGDNTTIEQEIREEGTYRACAIDNVGNVSEISEAFEIINVDGTIDNISLTPNITEITNSNIILTGRAQDEGAGIVGYGHFDNNNPDINGSGWTNIAATNAEVSSNRTVSTNGTYYFCAKDALGNVGCAKYEVTNIDKRVPDLTLTANTTSYATSVTLTGTARDNTDANNAASGIRRYQITTSSSRPSSGWTTASSGQMNITTSISVNNNTTYYLWVEDNVGNVTSKSLRVSNIIVLRSTTDSLYSETSSRISGSTYISNAVQLDSVVIRSGSGYVTNAYLSGRYVYYTANGGSSNSSQRYETFTTSPYRYSADSECTSYSCNRGGSADRYGYCTGSDYPLYGGVNEYECRNGSWVSVYDSEHYCETGYTKRWSCPPAPTGSCTNGDYKVNDCPATCEWNGDYRGTCRNVSYYCDYGDDRIGQTCYSCSHVDGYLNNSMKCEYEDLVRYTYWEYDVTINYYVLK